MGTPNGAGLYLALVQLLFTLGWTVYAIFLPQMAAAVGIPRPWVIWILIADQVIFAVMDYAMGVMADRVSRLVGQLGRIMVLVTAVSCAAFVALPFVAGAGPSMQPVLLALIVIWAVTSSVLRAPPMMLLGKYVPLPRVPWLASLALLGVGVAGAVAPYLTVVLRGGDPRLPFVLSSAALLLATFGLVAVERRLAGQAKASSAMAPRALSPAEPASVFLLAVVLLGLGFQVHTALNSAPQFLRFAKPTDLDLLLPVFWIGFNIAMFPASVLTRRYGGLMVMGAASVIGGVATHVGVKAGGLEILIVAQAVAGAAWGAMLMSAVSAALAIGRNGAEGRLVGTMYAALALATVVRMGFVAGGVPADPTYGPMLAYVPAVAWVMGGAALLVLLGFVFQRRPASQPE